MECTDPEELDDFIGYNVTTEPLLLFKKWIKEALLTPMIWPKNFVLGTVDKDGQPHGVVVTLESFDSRGFVFCLNCEGPRDMQLESNTKASMLFQWEMLYRQVRITGIVTKLTREEDIVLYKRQHRDEKLYHPFKQSNPISARNEEGHKENLFGEDGVKDELGPEFWGGFCLCPGMIEFLDIKARPVTPRRYRFVLSEDGKWNKQMLSL